MAAPRHFGEAHHRAKITDRDAELMREQLDERRSLIKALHAEGQLAGYIRRQLIATRLSFGAIAQTFEMSKSYVRAIDADRFRIYSGAR